VRVHLRRQQGILVQQQQQNYVWSMVIKNPSMFGNVVYRDHNHNHNQQVGGLVWWRNWHVLPRTDKLLWPLEVMTKKRTSCYGHSETNWINRSLSTSSSSNNNNNNSSRDSIQVNGTTGTRQLIYFFSLA
jgi:hypothetical protein